MANIGGIVAGQIYQTDAAPRYYLGHGWSLGSLVFAWSLWWVLRRLYQRREEAKRAEVQAQAQASLGKGPSAEREEDTAPAYSYTDRSTSFKYII